MRISDWSSDVCSSDLRGLMKGSDKILARGHVDRGLAADAAVDLREQGRRDLDEVAAALDDAAREAAEVADHAAAKSDDMVAALDTSGDQPFGERRAARPAFRSFPGVAGGGGTGTVRHRQRGSEAGKKQIGHKRAA